MKATTPRSAPPSGSRSSGPPVSAPSPSRRTPPARKILETPEEERLRILEEEGWNALSSWADVMLDLEANSAARDLYAELVRRGVKDPETAEALVPHYPMGCKRQIIDIGYFDTFNRDNVTLVDLRKGAITEITPAGIVTEQGAFDFDVIVFATGFDAMTGALNRIDITGRQGRLLRDVWSGEGAVSYLGLQVGGFPNLFTVTGPGSPSVLTNMVMSIEHHVEWITDCVTYLRDHGLRTIEATEEAQSAWVDHVASLVVGVARTSDALQLLVPRCQRARQEAGVHALRRRSARLPGQLRRDRRRRLRRFHAGLARTVPVGHEDRFGAFFWVALCKAASCTRRRAPVLSRMRSR